MDRGKPAEVSLAFRGTAPRARPFSVVETVGGERRSAAMPALRIPDFHMSSVSRGV